jgi:hypothetical protein
MNAADIETPTETESDRVICWRASELIRAGFPDETAVELAERPEIDLHVALALVVAAARLAGCAHPRVTARAGQPIMGDWHTISTAVHLCGGFPTEA